MTVETRASAAERRIELAIRGMHCSACAATVEAALKRVPGVDGAEVSFAAELAVVHVRDGAAPLEALAGAVRAAGYSAAAAGATADRARLRAETRELVVALALAVLTIGAAAWFHGARWTLALLAVAAVAGPGRSFVTGAIAGLRLRRAGMDLLVAIGAGAAAATALLAAAGAIPPTMDHGHAAVWLVAYLRAGKWIEARVRGRASAGLVALLDVLPERARVRAGHGGEERDVEARALAPGDRLVVAPAGRIAADGVVVEGSSTVDESRVTGEAEPVEKGPGAAVFAGSINVGGRLEVEVRATGVSTQLGQMAAIVRDALVAKSPVATLAERVAGVFVPAVLLLAVAAAIGAAAAGAGAATVLARALATVVISCPCALALATPTAVLAGCGRALRSGILVKDAAALEELAHVRTVLFDKTGTLTLGRPAVVAALRMPRGRDAAAVRTLAGASNHPMAAAVARALKEVGAGGAALTEVEEVAGRGVRGRADGEEWRLGRPDFAVADARALPESGRSLVAASRAGELVALFELEDPPRADAAAAVATLRAAGIAVALVTGDRAEPAEGVARACGIDEVHASCSPAQKAELVAERVRSSGPTAFVGDGFNDGAALAKATVGIAMGGGTELARAAGRLVLLRERIGDVAEARAIAVATLRVIRQNLFLAAAYNVVAIPWAMGLFARFGASDLEPAHAGLAMAVSSLAVVLNAARLASRN
jgi:Cu+-exporting ATPase